MQQSRRSANRSYDRLGLLLCFTRVFQALSGRNSRFVVGTNYPQDDGIKQATEASPLASSARAACYADQWPTTLRYNDIKATRRIDSFHHRSVGRSTLARATAGIKRD